MFSEILIYDEFFRRLISASVIFVIIFYNVLFTKKYSPNHFEGNILLMYYVCLSLHCYIFCTDNF